MPERGPPLYLGGNDAVAKTTPITKHNDTTDAVELATGLTGCTFRLAATESGAAIHASLSKTAVEKGALAIYFATFEGTDLVTHLTAFAGRDVFQIFGDAVNINYVVIRKVVAVRP